MKDEEVTNEALSIHLKYIREELEDIKLTLKDFKDKYVTREEFAPIKLLVYGFVGIILITVVGSLLYLVVK